MRDKKLHFTSYEASKLFCKDSGHAFPDILDLCAYSIHLYTAEILYDEQLQRLKTTFEAAFMTSYQLKLWTNLYELERPASMSWSWFSSTSASANQQDQYISSISGQTCMKKRSSSTRSTYQEQAKSPLNCGSVFAIFSLHKTAFWWKAMKSKSYTFQI